MKNQYSDGWTALHYAVQEGYFEAVQLLIEEVKVNIDARTAFNKTPLHFACRKGDDLFIRYLIEKGACATVVDRDGYTPLHYLCENENYEMIKLILPYCKQAKDVRNRFGKKPTDMIGNNKEIKKLIRNMSQGRNSSCNSQIRSVNS